MQLSPQIFLKPGEKFEKKVKTVDSQCNPGNVQPKLLTPGLDPIDGYKVSVR